MSQDDARATLWPRRLTLPWLVLAALVFGVSLVTTYFDRISGLAEILMKEQDLPVAVAVAAFLLVLRTIPAGSAWLRRLPPPPAVSPGRIAIFAAAGAGLVAIAGWFLVMGGYPLSTDEFLAGFDATTFGEGRLHAVVPPEWRPLRFPLQPQYTLLPADGASWSSGYLPVNALFLALADRLGAPALAGAVWAGVAVLALYGVARRLWPERPDAAVVAVVLLATSSQFLFAPMTRYAMSAHLALNLVWLWLFLRDRRASQVAALAIGFLATGLHQVVFHPLFVAPFLLELWLSRRWGKAGFYTLGYLVIGLFWLSYWRIFFPAGPTAGGDARDVWFRQIQYVMEQFDLDRLDGVAKGLARFLTWQNPVTLALAAVAVPAAWKLGSPFRPMLLGMLLTLLVMLAAVPDQGHGWGYRYLHGFLGCACLFAALAWVRTTDTMSPEVRRATGLGFAAAAVFSLVVLLPWRAAQAGAFIRPYAAAAGAIERAEDVDIVAVDATGMFYAADLVRNDPFLRNRPKVVDLVVMRERHIRAMCAGRRVAVFDRLSGADLRPVVYPRRNLDQLAQNRRLMAELGCGGRRVMVRR